MAVRNQHVRQSSPYIFKTIDGVRYMFWAAPFVMKTKARYIANKASAGKLELDKTLTGVEVQEDGSIKQIKL